MMHGNSRIFSLIIIKSPNLEISPRIFRILEVPIQRDPTEVQGTETKPNRPIPR